MNLCITGALGHIGSALIRRLPKNTFDKIYLVDNLLTQRYASLFNLPDGYSFQFKMLDILDKQIEEIINDCDVVVHLAAITDAQSSYYKIDELEEVNKRGLRHVANLCARHNVRLLFPSTTSVYSVTDGVADEESKGLQLKAQTPYAQSKLYAEKLLRSLGEKKKLKYTILRFGTIFGYSIGMRFHTAVNKFIWEAVLQRPLSVWKTALHQKRPYCSLVDCVDAINFVISNNVFENTLYNIVTINVTVAEITQVIKKFLPSLTLNLVDSPIMNQLSYSVSTTKSLKRGFSYSGKLEREVKETVERLRNSYSI